MRKLLAHKRLVVITSVLAILGLTLSLFADTAGGIATMHSKTISANQSVAAGGVAGAAAGGDAVNTGFRASALAADFVQPSSGSASTSTAGTASSDESSVPAGQPTTPPNGDSNDNSENNQTPTPTPQSPCTKCPTPKFRGEGTMVACDYCVQPSPACQPCGGFRKAETSDAIACPMVMCAEE